MNELTFKSQICTTVEQSKKLLELGLKPETADMAWACITKEGLTQWVMTLNTPKNKPNIDIPAWSLHRLLELNSASIMEGTIAVLKYDNTYDDIIENMEWTIKKDYFNKGYLNK